MCTSACKHHGAGRLPWLQLICNCMDQPKPPRLPCNCTCSQAIGGVVEADVFVELHRCKGQVCTIQVIHHHEQDAQ